MSEPPKKILPVLIAVSKLDSSLGRILIERKRIKGELDAKLAVLKKSQGESDLKARELAEKK